MFARSGDAPGASCADFVVRNCRQKSCENRKARASSVWERETLIPRNLDRMEARELGIWAGGIRRHRFLSFLRRRLRCEVCLCRSENETVLSANIVKTILKYSFERVV